MHVRDPFIVNAAQCNSLQHNLSWVTTEYKPNKNWCFGLQSLSSKSIVTMVYYHLLSRVILHKTQPICPQLRIAQQTTVQFVDKMSGCECIVFSDGETYIRRSR